VSEEQNVPVDMACEKVVEIVTEYLEGALDQETAAAVEYHLALCPGCDDYLQQMRTTILLVGRVPVETLSVAARDELLTAFHDFHADGNTRYDTDGVGRNEWRD
jgi:predicted anti-sigma-YlaC factor YlaD